MYGSGPPITTISIRVSIRNKKYKSTRKQTNIRVSKINSKHAIVLHVLDNGLVKGLDRRFEIMLIAKLS